MNMFVIVSGQTSPPTFGIRADPCELLNFEHGGVVEKGLCRTSGAFRGRGHPEVMREADKYTSAKLFRLASQLRAPLGTSSFMGSD
jgi:hypothetical protein